MPVAFEENALKGKPEPDWAGPVAVNSSAIEPSRVASALSRVKLDRSLPALTGQAAIFCGCPLVSSHVVLSRTGFGGDRFSWFPCSGSDCSGSFAVVVAAAVSQSEPGGRAEREGGGSVGEEAVVRAAARPGGDRGRRRRAVVGAVSGCFGGDHDETARCKPFCRPRRGRRDRSAVWIRTDRGDQGGVALLELDRRDVAEALVQAAVVEPSDVLDD